MSDYWMALARAALGADGTALPRPRSIYEADGPDPVGDEVEEIEEWSSQATAEPATPPALPPHLEGAEPRNVREPSEPSEPRRARDDADHTAEVRVEATEVERAKSGPVDPQDEPTSSETIVVRTIERVEVHRVEAVPIAAEPVPAAQRDEVPPQPAVAAALPRSAAPEEAPLRDEVPVPERSAEVDAPVPLVAEPIAAPAEPERLAPAAQEPPLVIEIDRIEIRIEAEPGPPATVPRRRDPMNVPSLGDYLAGRSGVPQ